MVNAEAGPSGSEEMMEGPRIVMELPQRKSCRAVWKAQTNQ
jgi:hypothetical protein